MCNRMMIVALVTILTGCTRGSQDDLRPFVAVSGYYSLMGSTTPQPQGPVKCGNCNGLGYLTDGTVRTVCPICNGNKVTQCRSGTCRLNTGL